MQNRSIWINIDYNHGNPYSCTCGNCGYKSMVGRTNFCPKCGCVMDLKFANEKARKIYERLAEYKHKYNKKTMDAIIKDNRLIYSWRVIVMLNYLKTMLLYDDYEASDILKVINSYLDFTEETVDARIVELKSDDYKQ